MRIGLRTRVAIGFALLSVAVAVAVSVPTYLLTQYYLIEQRERSAVTRAVLNAGEFAHGLDDGQAPSQAMQNVPIVGISRAFALVDGAWVTNGGTLLPSQTPLALRDQNPGEGAKQRFIVDGTPYLGIGIGLEAGTYVEIFPLTELRSLLTTTRAVLVITTVVAALAGALIGFLAAGRLLTPLQRIASSARRIADGDRNARIDQTKDADLEPIVEALNDMVDAVQAQIERERRFSANVSHELRSPLTAVVGTAELLTVNADALPEREAALARVLQEQVQRLSSMLLDLMEISKITSGEASEIREPVDLRALCESALRDRGSSAPVAGEAVVIGDARRVERIISNVVDNAVLHAGGVVAIGIACDGGQAIITVDDRGSGIAEADRERLFEPFMRGDAAIANTGAGLGLAIAREQATIAGGSIEVDDAPAGGARFRITLPLGVSE